jgi:DNA-binding transcriptional LysR family regulator
LRLKIWKAPSTSLFIRHHAQGVSDLKRAALYDKAKELLRLSYEFEQNSRADKELVSGTISIGCFESVAPLYMPKLVAGFKKMYPEITLQLYDGEQHELMHGLHRGRFDLALVYDLELGHSIHKEPLNAPHKPYACCLLLIRWRRKMRHAPGIKPGADDFARCGTQQKLFCLDIQRERLSP